MLEHEHDELSERSVRQILEYSQERAPGGVAITVRELLDVTLQTLEFAVEGPFGEPDTATRNAEARPFPARESPSVVGPRRRDEDALAHRVLAEEAPATFGCVHERLQRHRTAIAIERREQLCQAVRETSPGKLVQGHTLATSVVRTPRRTSRLGRRASIVAPRFFPPRVVAAEFVAASFVAARLIAASFVTARLVPARFVTASFVAARLVTASFVAARLVTASFVAARLIAARLIAARLIAANLIARALIGFQNGQIRWSIRHGVGRQAVATAHSFFTASPTTTTATASALAATLLRLRAFGRRLFDFAAEDRLVIVFLGLEEVGRVRGHGGSLPFGGVEHARDLGFAFFRRLEVRAARVRADLLGFARHLGSQAFERGGSIQKSLFDRRRIPVAERENARLDADEGVILVPLFDERRESRAHGHLGALAHVTEQIFFDGDVSYLFVM
jgi:hypothetical protein